MTTHPTGANHIQARRYGRGGRSLRARRRWRAAPALALVVMLAALAVTSGARGATNVNAVASHAAASRANHVAAGATPRIERADIHVDDLPNASEFEMDLAITQTQNDCDTSPRGQLCLRYTISTDDIASEDGYGLIPISAVRVTPSTITLSIDTTHDSHMNLLAGRGGLITLTWYVPSGLPHPANQAASLAVATVQGSILGYVIPNSHVTAAVLITSGS